MYVEKDEFRSDRQITEKVYEILEKVQQDNYISIVDTDMELDPKMILKHLHKAGYKKMLDVCASEMR